jgi:precorrin-2 methylase
MRKFKRVYHPYELWEEIKFGMWDDVSDEKEWLEKAILFTGDHKLYGSFMMRVVSEWPISCENALTDYNINRRAWVGHAACALGMGCPEHITRKAWRFLSYEQQYLANEEASRAIRAWENNYFKSQQLRESLGGTLL